MELARKKLNGFVLQTIEAKKNYFNYDVSLPD